MEIRGLIGPARWAVALAIAQAVLVSPALSQTVVRDAMDSYLAAYARPSVRGPAPSLRPRTLDIPADSLTGVVKQYCVVCHNQVMLTGNLSL